MMGAAVSPKLATMMGASVSTPPSPMSPQPKRRAAAGQVKAVTGLHAVKKNGTQEAVKLNFAWRTLGWRNRRLAKPRDVRRLDSSRLS